MAVQICRRGFVATLMLTTRPSVVALVGCSTIAGSTAAGPSFVGLGTLPGTGYSSAVAVSGDGSVVVGACTYDTTVLPINTAFRWTRSEGMVSLGALPDAPSSTAFAASADGSVIVGKSEGDTTGIVRAFRWTSSKGMESIAGSPSAGYGVSRDGSVIVGTARDATGQGGLRWTDSGGVGDIGNLRGYTLTIAKAASADGSVVAGFGQSSIFPSGWAAFRWTSAGGMVDLGQGFATAVSADGSVVVGWNVDSYDTSYAFRWTSGGGMVNLGPGEACAVNADGSMVVGARFVWTASTGMVDLSSFLSGQGLDLSGWVLTDAQGVSADGRTIVGNGLHNGSQEAWAATIEPLCHGGDFNHSGSVTIQDVFDFLAAWFRGSPSADFNHTGPPNVRDIYAFICVWLASCP